MKKIIFVLVAAIIAHTTNAQPFRHIQGNEKDRDSVRLLHIKGYKEYQALFSNQEERILIRKVEYDVNGNLIRDWRLNTQTGNQNQWTYLYNSGNLLLEEATYFPDSMTYNQRTIHHYDSAGNKTEKISEYYANGELSTSSKILMRYDSQNNLIELKGINWEGKITAYYGYKYDEFGNRIEEITYNNEGEVLYQRPVQYWMENNEEPIGFPERLDPETQALREEHVYHYFDTYRVEDGYGHRIFTKNNVLIYWEEKNSMIYWFEYTYYE